LSLLAKGWHDLFLLGTDGAVNMLSKSHVELISRSNDFRELDEMRAFLAEAEAQDVDHLLVRLFYDTKACLCIIDTVDGADESPDVVFLSQAAHNHISQYQLFGTIGHGGSFA